MLYLITDGINTKVGICLDWKQSNQRLATHQTGNAAKLSFFCILPEYGATLESQVLKHFKEHKCPGGQEWLSLSPPVVLAYIAEVTGREWLLEVPNEAHH